MSGHPSWRILASYTIPHICLFEENCGAIWSFGKNMPVALTGNGFSKYAFYMKNKWKLLIDLIMVFVFVTLYDKHAISLEYHEIAGFAVLGIALVHLALNWRWVVGTTKNLFRKTGSARLHVMYTVDFLLVVSIIVMAISSVLISKVVFPGITASAVWKVVHYSMAAFMLLLIGVHLGLHVHSIYVRLGGKSLGKTIGIVILILCFAVAAFGVFSMTSTSFLKWFGLPFTYQSIQNAGTGQHNGLGLGQGRGLGIGQGAGELSAEAFSLPSFLLIIARFASITFAIALVTYLCDRRITKRRLRPMR